MRRVPGSCARGRLLRVRGVHTRVRARLCKRVCVYPCLFIRVCSRIPWGSRPKTVSVTGMWRQTRGLLVCAHKCAYVHRDVCPCSDVYWAAWVEDALRTVGFHICIYMLACRQVSGSFSCIELVPVCALLCARERVHAACLSRDIAVSEARASLQPGSLGEGRQTRVPAVPYTRAHVRPRGSVLMNMS